MMIWDIIRDWFVMNIWGGVTSSQSVFSPALGSCNFYVNGLLDEGGFYYLTDFYVDIGGGGDISVTLSLADWLSTTSTIIILVAVCVGLFYLTRYFFRMFAGLISGR